MSGADVGDPVAHRFVDSFLERGLSGGDRNNFCAQKFHPCDIERLSFHVDLAHVNHALAAKARGDSGGGNAVLAGAGLGDDAAFAHSLGEQDLAERVIDFVCPSVEQVLALQINFSAAEFAR